MATMTTNGPLGLHHVWSAVTLAVSLTGAGAVARADTLSDLREQTEALQRKVNELENAQQKTAPTSAVTGGDIPGSFKLPGLNTSINLGRDVQVDPVYIKNTLSLDSVANQQTVNKAIPRGPPGSPSADKNSRLALNARQRRLQ